MQVTFRKDTEPDKPDPVKTYVFGPGEPPDIRGYWQSTIELFPQMAMRIGLKIGRLPDGSFQALMDFLDQGASDIPSASVSYSDGAAKIDWQMFNLDSKLSADGNELSGTWKQGPRGVPATFVRLAKPATPLPEGISWIPDGPAPEDLRGEWNGTLEIEGNRLRLAFKIGRLPDGSYAGALVSLDQGGRELPSSNLGYTNPVVRMEWKAIRGTYTGTVKQDGTEMEGTWEQMGRSMPLRLKRAPVPEPPPKS
jgi:hypothetical protein